MIYFIWFFNSHKQNFLSSEVFSSTWLFFHISNPGVFLAHSRQSKSGHTGFVPQQGKQSQMPKSVWRAIHARWCSHKSSWNANMKQWELDNLKYLWSSNSEMKMATCFCIRASREAVSLCLCTPSTFILPFFREVRIAYWIFFYYTPSFLFLFCSHQSPFVTLSQYCTHQLV